MRWFKHFCDAHHDEDMELLIDLYGLEGYGMWWLLVEHLASQLDENNKTYLALPEKIWQKNLRISKKKFEKISGFLQEKQKIILEKFENSPVLYKIDCPKLLKFRDEYTQRRERCRDKLPIVSGQTPVQDTDIDTDKEEDKKEIKKKENPLFDIFWSKYLCRPNRKGSKKEAAKKFSLLHADDQKKAIDALPVFQSSEDWTKNNMQYIPGAVVYLNQRLWDGLDGIKQGQKSLTFCTQCGGSGFREVKRFINDKVQIVKEPCDCGVK